MKSIQAEFEKLSKKITIKKGAKEEDWVSVCEKFNDDVSRICDVVDQQDYTGLFECCDDDNKRFFYLVKEDKNLYRVKHRHFLDNLGLK
ncbi:MAG: hypothetical protein HOG03_19785 [Desulfobacula sp.]|jgi:hypothetical protein|uniref:hypothetical protein n=1 Tax=Desulfobacula sp. TaxID=2593537 RepID=UPI001DE96FB1|nr:hypothetical protein [Desulfobacula sp.]MBT3487238.1 hypothetical protein [Desulfobacula sp.]MBT3806811.1 hypothetical protein [Desulfobacula sp.]MBT4027119.1 hypothetical protein [Desulfobacula sp.]MBT4200863.1 hypothetical protein [Desulfobacula sp.]